MSLTLRRLTPSGSGAIAVIALGGEGAAERLSLLCPKLPGVGELRLARLGRDDLCLDLALVVRRGEEHFELGVHGNPFLVEELMELLGAGSGEGYPSVEEASLAALERAPCDRAARVLLDQARGALRGAARPEEGWVGRWKRFRFLLEPPLVLLAGPVNAGKSTLFNLLVGQERVGVSAEPGTTRDAISARIQLGHYAFDLVDSAGERSLSTRGMGEEQDEIEVAGQELARHLRERADLVLWLDPGGVPAPPVRGGVLRCLRSRLDDGPPETLSALARPREALALVRRTLFNALGLPQGDPWIAGLAVPPDRGWASALEERGEAALGPRLPLPLP